MGIGRWLFVAALVGGWSAPAAFSQETVEKPADSRSPLAADEDFPGTEDFEKASRIRVTSNSRESYAEVIALCRSALEKGLDEIDAAAAKKMLATTAFDRAQATIEAASSTRLPNSRLAQIANEALKDLDAAIEFDPQYADALILKGRLHVLRSEIKKGLDALDLAQSALEAILEKADSDLESKNKLSEVLVMKSVLRQDADERLSDLLKAMEVNPENQRAVQQSVETLASLGRIEEAEAAIRKFLEVDPDNDYAIRRLVLLLSQEQKIDDALELLNQKIEAFSDRSDLYALRAALHLARSGDDDSDQALVAALEDCNKAIELDADNLDAVLTRAKIAVASKDLELAKKDLATIEAARPDLPDLALLRMDVAIQEKRFADAISDLESLVQMNPENRMLLMQLGSFYQLDNRPKKALRIADRLVKSDATDWQALRLRADIQLALGRHSDAITDYEAALENVPQEDDDYSGILNNLSWVLSTSPDDSVRNGERALELGQKACELTDYAKPHILSTLAAAYAELQKFDKAKEWAAKAVELGRSEGNEQTEQLEKELKSYEEGKPWREKQEIQDKPGKKPGDDGIDT